MIASSVPSPISRITLRGLAESIWLARSAELSGGPNGLTAIAVAAVASTAAMAPPPTSARRLRGDFI